MEREINLLATDPKLSVKKCNQKHIKKSNIQGSIDNLCMLQHE